MQRLFGRTAALARARLRLARAFAGEGGLMLFTGEPGIGKSSLAEHLAAEAARDGATVAWGRCWEAGGAPSYWPWIQLFRELQMDGDPFAAERVPAGDAEQARFQAFDATVRRLKEAAAHRPLVLVLDDLQAADVPSLLLLLLLVRQVRGSRLMVLGTYRDAELRFFPEVAALLTKVAREGEVLPLARLTADECGAWIADAWPDASAAQRSQLHRLTEGHPLFLVEGLRLGPGAEAQQRMLEGLGAVLDERLAHLSPATHELLQAAAVLGREFAAADVAVAAGRTGDEVHRALREASAASIVRLVPGDPGQSGVAGDRYRFAHVLLRDRLYGELAPSARARLHWQAGNAQLARGEDPQTAVHHFFEGASAGQVGRATEVALAAAESSLARLAFEEAARVAERGLDLAARAPETERLVCQLKLAAGEAAIRLGESRGKRLCVEAAALAAPLGADDLLIRAALVYGIDLASGSVDPTMVALLRQALARLPPGDSSLRARVCARLAAALSPPTSDEAIAEMQALTDTATAMARRLGDPHTLLQVLPFVVATAGFAGPDTERLALLQETVTLARLHDQRLVLLNALPAYVTALIAIAARAEAEAALADYDGLLAALPQTQQQWRSRLLHALVDLVRGDLEAADRKSGEARDMIEAAGSQAGMNLWMFQRFSFAYLRGQPELASGTVGPLLLQLPSSSSTLPLAAWLDAASGRPEQAAARLQAFVLEPHRHLGLRSAADTFVLLGDSARGSQLYPLVVAAGVQPFTALSPGALLGPHARTLGDLALLIGRRNEAVAHYERGIADCERLGAGWLAETCRQARTRALASPEVAPAPARGPRLELRREGDVWAVVTADGPVVRLKHAKGFGYLSSLLEQPGREVHVLELLGVEHKAGDAGPLLDARAKAEYGQRLEDLRDQLAEAERFADQTRTRRVQAEIEAIAEQLAGAVGLGGRDRLAASDVERARINVQRRLKAAIDQIAAVHPELGRYLSAAVRTGTTCVFLPL